MDEVSEDTLERAALAAGLEGALSECRDDVLAAARAALGYQRRRTPVADMTLEPGHVYDIPEVGHST